MPECVQSTLKFGGGSVMVLGCITSDGVGPLTTVDGRMKAKDYIDLLEQTLVSFMTTMGPDYVFQHCYVNISLYTEKLELFASVALLLAGTVYMCVQKKIIIERTRDLRPQQGNFLFLIEEVIKILCERALQLQNTAV